MSEDSKRVTLVGISDASGATRMPKVFSKAGFRVGTISPINNILASSVYIDCRFYWKNDQRIKQQEQEVFVEELLVSFSSWRSALFVPTDSISLGLLVKAIETLAQLKHPDALALHIVLTNSLSANDVYRKLIGRSNLREFASSVGLGVTPQIVVDNAVSVYDFIEREGLPVELVAQNSSFSLKIEIASDLDRISEYISLNLGAQCICKKIGLPIFIVSTSCNQGKVVDAFSVKVIETIEVEGIPSVIELVTDEALFDIAKLVIGRFEASGVISIIVNESREGRLLFEECVFHPILCSHLGEVFGRDIIKSLFNELNGISDESAVKPKQSKVALFPQAWQRNPNAEILCTSASDVPWSEPELLRCLVNSVNFSLR